MIFSDIALALSTIADTFMLKPLPFPEGGIFPLCPVFIKMFCGALTSKLQFYPLTDIIQMPQRMAAIPAILHRLTCSEKKSTDTPRTSRNTSPAMNG